jgi:hypothetical protein
MEASPASLAENFQLTLDLHATLGNQYALKR